MDNLEFCENCDCRKFGEYEDFGGAYYSNAEYCDCFGIVFDDMTDTEIMNIVTMYGCRDEI